MMAMEVVYNSIPAGRDPNRAAYLGMIMGNMQKGQIRQKYNDRTAGLASRLGSPTQPTSQPRSFQPQSFYAGRNQQMQQMQAGPQVSTQIGQGMLYPPAHMQRMSNRAFGAAMQAADPRMAQQQFAGRGLSMDAGTLAAAMPGIADATSQAMYARHVQPLNDQLANQAYALQGQQAQGNQFMGLANLYRGQQANQFNRQQNAIGPLLQAALGF